jgi:hypothetical protein
MLTTNGSKISEGRVECTTPCTYSSYKSQDSDEDTKAPVDFTYEPLCKLNGKLGRVTVECE